MKERKREEREEGIGREKGQRSEVEGMKERVKRTF